MTALVSMSDAGGEEYCPAPGLTYAPKKRGRPPKKAPGRPEGQNFPDGISASAGHCPANLELRRLINDGSAQLISRSRLRQAAKVYTDPGAQTRFPRGTPLSCSDGAAEILASLAMGVIEDECAEGRVRHPSAQRLLDVRESASKSKRKDAVQAAKKERAAHAKRLADNLFLTKSWLDRKEDAFLAYASSLNGGGSKAEAYKAAAQAARVCQRTCESWCPEYLENDGEFNSNSWGCNVKNPSAFSDTEVRLKGAQWWRNNTPKKGEPNARICDFREYMLNLPVFQEVRGAGGARQGELQRGDVPAVHHLFGILLPRHAQREF